jgi:acetolactate synthase I/II/III large subunit
MVTKTIQTSHALRAGLTTPLTSALIGLSSATTVASAVVASSGYSGTATELERDLIEWFSSEIDASRQITGAELISALLWKSGFNTAFAYPGTSELALCRAFDQCPGTNVINSFGDGEAVFMSAGFSMNEHACRCVAVLHGARGLTNSLGAIADIARNELPALILVGLPSSHTIDFLPPHGEVDLIPRAGKFAKSYQLVQGDVDGQALAQMLIDAISSAHSIPCGPVLFGVPQDVFERPICSISDIPFSLNNSRHLGSISAVIPDHIIRSIANARRIAIIFDDYFLKLPRAVEELIQFMELTPSAAFQVRYTRGPMFFAQPSRELVLSNPRIAGWYDPLSEEQRRFFGEVDLILTLEDRNCYPRVVGKLPSCRKFAFTSSRRLTIKNRYIDSEYDIVEGPPQETLALIGPMITNPSRLGTLPPRLAATPQSSPIVEGFYSAIDCNQRILVVDDSQMLGGLLSKRYGGIPENVTVFGDHGGFVGSGISYAVGASISRKWDYVLCLTGDHGFLNGVQGLLCLADQEGVLGILVCNNGGSASLKKEERASDRLEKKYLNNPRNVDYTDVASAFGLIPDTITVYCRDSSNHEQRNNPLEDAIRNVILSRKRALINMIVCDDDRCFEDIWRTEGTDAIQGRLEL